MDDVLLLGVGHYGVTFIKSIAVQLKGSSLDCFGVGFEASGSEPDSSLGLRIHKPGVATLPNGKPLPMHMFVDGLIPRRDQLVLITEADNCDGFFLTQAILSIARQTVPDIRVILKMPVKSDDSGQRLIADCLADCARHLANEVVPVEGCIVDCHELILEDSWDEIHKQIYLACQAFLPGFLPQFGMEIPQ